ncbi:MAG: hypothetical protein JXM73_23270 [Anaerolineae bacterium]|nr:hypothetical protein [Anaerolineae bacterium]
MTDRQQASRFEVVVEEGPPHGDLFELEQTTYYHVVDRHTRQVVMTFQSEMEASLSRDSGVWDDYQFSGVCEVVIAPDETAAIVSYCDGREERITLVP